MAVRGVPCSYFPLEIKELEAKKKGCGPVWLDCGVQEEMWPDVGVKSSPPWQEEGPQRSCKVLPGSRDLLRTEQFTWASLLQRLSGSPLCLGRLQMP